MSPRPGIEVRAPARIDLAGGTLDLYPLYLFEEDGVTLNAAIDVYSHVTIEPRDDAGIVLCSEDMGVSQTFDGLADLEVDGDLALLARAVRCYSPPTGVEIRTRNDAPQGSGLGASSALLMALSVGLTRLFGIERSYTELIDIGANIEAQVIGIPTGKQDYYSALYGGVSSLHFGVQGHSRTALCDSDSARSFFESHLVLSFTGVSHFSGANNWEMMRNYIDGNPQTRTALQRIGRTAREVHHCVESERWDRLPDLLAEEWHNRRELADGVTTPDIDRMMEAAVSAGAVASKLCGAGGGGCMITYASPDCRPAVEKALQDVGAEVIAFALDVEGVNVQEYVVT